MRIGGLLKLTLLDFPGKLACTVFTPGCNFRCPFCHNASLVRSKNGELGEDEFFRFLEKRRGVLDGVCVSGGEPTMRDDITEFISRIKSLGFAVKLDTNGSSVQKLRELTDAGLIDYVAMDIKNSPTKYAVTCGGADFLEKVRESVSFLMSSDIDFEFRTTVVNELHSDADFHEIGKWIANAPRYYLQTFKDSGDILSEGMSASSDGDMKRYLSIVKKYIPTARLRGSDI